MARCVLCLQEKEPLTDEHVIYAALGGDLCINSASCEDCQKRCNKEFETKFLKGTNLVSMLRAALGIKGRNNEPIYGFDGHGSPLQIIVQSSFPPIRIGIGAKDFERPAQVILLDQNRSPQAYFYLPPKISRPIRAGLFESLVLEVPLETKFAALWLDGDQTPVNIWRELVDGFVAWADTKGLGAQVSSSAATSPLVQLTIEHNSPTVLRGIAKIALMYLLYKIPAAERYADELNVLRTFVLEGRMPCDDLSFPLGPVKQCSGQHPAHEALGDISFTYLLAVAHVGSSLYVLVQLHHLGVYAVKVGTVGVTDLLPDTMSTFVLSRNEGTSRFTLTETEYPHNLATQVAANVPRCL